MDFKAGKVYTIVGKSGAGKSALLSLLSGLDAATSDNTPDAMPSLGDYFSLSKTDEPQLGGADGDFRP